MQSLFIELVNPGDRGAALVNIFSAGSKCLDILAAILGAELIAP